MSLILYLFAATMSPRFRFILKEHEGDLCVIIIIIIIMPQLPVQSLLRCLYSPLCAIVCVSICARRLKNPRALAAICHGLDTQKYRVQELCESGAGRPGLSVLMSITVSVDVEQH